MKQNKEAKQSLSQIKYKSGKNTNNAGEEFRIKRYKVKNKNEDLILSILCKGRDFYFLGRNNTGEDLVVTYTFEDDDSEPIFSLHSSIKAHSNSYSNTYRASEDDRDEIIDSGMHGTCTIQDQHMKIYIRKNVTV